MIRITAISAAAAAAAAVSIAALWQRLSKSASPKVVLVDIDGTVSDDIPNERSHEFATAGVIPGAVQSVNALTERGHEVHFFTARPESSRAVTTKWLNTHGFQYETLIMGKPRSLGREYVVIDNIKFTAHHFKRWCGVSVI